MEKLTGFIGLLLLATSFILLVLSIHKGKRMVAYLKHRYPKQWDDMGNPAPGYFQSLERNRWTRFIWKREYRQFNDEKLTEMGDVQRKLETKTIGFIILFVVGFGGLVLWFELTG